LIGRLPFPRGVWCCWVVCCLTLKQIMPKKNLRQIGWVIGLGFMEIIIGFGRVPIGFDRVKPAQSGLLCGS
jgi:hypothetical protein